MIFKIHYFAFNAGLSGVLVMITVFLRKYSDASSTEVGTLLMVLPFVSVFTKPFFCALADRHRRYRLYFVLALAFTLLGFGSYTLLPFYPDFIEAHGRQAWWLLVASTVVGYISYGVVWSLGDAYAANVSHRAGTSFGLIRLWGTIGWGVAGAVVGALSPYLRLPEMVLGLLVFIVSHVFEIILLSWWPHNEDFEMGGDGGGRVKPAPQLTNQQVSEKPPPGRQDNNDQVTMMISLNGGSIRTEVRPRPQPPVDQLDKTISELIERAGSVVSPARALEEEQRALERKQIARLQGTIFRMVLVRHKSLLKYLLIFVALGAVYNIHWSYFFLHLERLAAEGKGASFSALVGLCLVAQAVGECFCFIIAPWVVRKLGRDGAISLNMAAYALRYFGNGLGIPLVSPYVALLTESLQGINYGIFYYLITDTALHYATQVDSVIPELQERGLIARKGADLEAVRTSLRATMQGVFSGAFDGLGFGLGSLVAGLLLETHTYEQLWCIAGAAALVIFVLHAVYECATSAWLRHRKTNTFEVDLTATTTTTTTTKS